MSDLQSNLNAWARAGLRDGYNLPAGQGRDTEVGSSPIRRRMRTASTDKNGIQLTLFEP